MEQSNRQKEAKNGNRSCLSAAIIDVVSHIGVFEEASSKAEFNGEFPNRIGLLPANFDDPTAVEVFLLNPATNAVCCLQELWGLYTILNEHFCCKDTFFKGKLIVNDIENWKRCEERNNCSSGGTHRRHQHRRWWQKS